MVAFEVSSAFVDSITRSLRHTEHFPALVKALSPKAAAMVANAWSDPWQPGELYVELAGQALRLLGAEAFEALSYASVSERFAPIVLPMIKKSLTTSNASPVAVLSRLGDLVQVAMRGLDVTWEAAAKNGGVLQVRYPIPVGPQIAASWRGVLKFVFEVTKPGAIEAVFHSPDGRMMQYRVSWEA